MDSVKSQKMTKAEAQAWMERWRLVNEVTIEEARAATPEERLRDLDQLGKWGQFLGWPADDPQVEEVRQRWIRLKELMP
jgi:hypothetical protein